MPIKTLGTKWDRFGGVPRQLEKGTSASEDAGPYETCAKFFQEPHTKNSTFTIFLSIFFSPPSSLNSAKTLNKIVEVCA